jgi:hypothetical protein
MVPLLPFLLLLLLLLLSTIGSVFLHVSPKYSMIDIKKKVVRVKQKLCKSCTRNITHSYICVFFFCWENYNLSLQTASYFASNITNCQRLDFDPSNYQKVSKRLIVSKYTYNTPITCHFSIT